jgi:MAP3K TRAFs-binding domain
MSAGSRSPYRKENSVTRPLCFVLMPFGKKPDAQGRVIDFDKVYKELIKPAIHAADFDAIRSDEDLIGGIIHKPMFERLILCPYAVADLTLANANVYYELGVRHAARPYSTVAIFAEGTHLPFDVTMLRCVAYRLQADGTPIEVEKASEALSKMLKEARKGADDSPVFQLVDLPWREHLKDLEHKKTDVFRERAKYSEVRKGQLAEARARGLPGVRQVEDDISADPGVMNEEIGVLIDLFLSYRAVKAWQDMIRLAAELPSPVARTVMMREQLAFALNRQAGECAKQGNQVQCAMYRDRAIKLLSDLIAERGPSSETNGILGRIYKDRWEETRDDPQNAALADGQLRKAIATYLQGFESDWRDAYPGINAVTLMEIREPPDDRRKALIPVVEYSVERKIAAKEPDYWDYATRLELAVLADDRARAQSALSDALAHQREKWEPETTARNLTLIQKARQKRGEDVAWLEAIIDQLKRASAITGKG